MSKIIITHEFERYEEQGELEEFLKAPNKARTLDDTLDHIRTKLKYDSTLTDEQEKVYEGIKEYIYNTLKDYEN